MKWRFCVPSVFLVFMLASCGAPLRYTSPAEPLQEVTNFSKTVDTWKQSGEIIRDWVTVLQVDALLESWELQVSHVLTKAKDLNWDSTETDEALLESQADFNAGISILCAVFTNNPQWNTWDEPGLQWNFFLQSGEEPPVKATKVDLITLNEADQERYYPYVRRWHKVYRVTFPRKDTHGTPLWTPLTPKLIFQVHGTLGELDLAWKFPQSLQSLPQH